MDDVAIPQANFVDAIQRIKDAQLRISRHKDFHHADKFTNDLMIINTQLSHALEALTMTGDRLGETNFMQEAKEALDQL